MASSSPAVNIGQTVVSSLSAPSSPPSPNLTKMQLWTAVNEADIGNIHEGQNVTFTVDVSDLLIKAPSAKPASTHKPGAKSSPTPSRSTPTTKTAPSRPYMTANVSFQVAKDVRGGPQHRGIADRYRVAPDADEVT